MFASFLVDIVFGMFNRIAPQLNAYFMAMGVKAMGGLAMFMFAMVLMVGQLAHHLVVALRVRADALDVDERGLERRRDRRLQRAPCVVGVRVLRGDDLALFLRLSNTPMPQTAAATPLQVVTPAFMISELKRAFEIGFLLFVPFLVIDLVVASVLMSMGMMMLPPVVVSLPLKLIFFVLVDGWRLVAGSLVESFRQGAGT